MQQLITKWTTFLHQKKYMDEKVTPAFKKISDAVVDITIYQMVGCGAYVNFAECTNDKILHYRGKTRCKQKFCIMCERVKSLLWTVRILEYIKAHSEEIDVYTMTLDRRSMENLSLMILEMEKSWRFIQHDDKYYRKIFNNRFIGGVRSLEVKRGKGGHGWHAHYHLLLITNKSYSRDIDWLKEAWDKATNGEGKQPYIKKINTKGNNLVKAVVECCKYITKYNTATLNNTNWLTELYYSLRGKRRVNSFGALRGINKQVAKDCQEHDEKERDLTNFICKVCGNETAELVVKQFNDCKDKFYPDYSPREIRGKI